MEEIRPLATGAECDKCRVPLFRVTEPGTGDIAVCPDCFAWGRYEEVVFQDRGLAKGRVLPDCVAEAVQKAWVTQILGGQN